MLREREREVAGAAAQIKCVIPRFNGGKSDDPALPKPVQAEALQVVDQIVTPRDGGEEVIDFHGALFPRGVEGVAHVDSLAHRLAQKSKDINSALHNTMDLLLFGHVCSEEQETDFCFEVIMNSESKSARTMKILVVDDNEIVLKTISLKLQGAGYQVITALDGSQAVTLARTENPDLILLDISFPPDVDGVPWDGFRIMEWFHRLDTAKKIPIIIITGNEDAKYKERAVTGGAVAFFHKPIDHDDLLKVIRATLGTVASQPA
jgi:twitching motility two-component system response regulator PilH